MKFSSTQLPYQNTGYFSKIITDYLAGNAELQPFYAHPTTLDGVREAIAQRKNFATDRNALVTALQEQYNLLPAADKTNDNIRLLADENTFTITTAHQPVIFTGPLFFIYKILHVIRLCEWCRSQLPQYNFVPVFYMGSEDADLEELGTIWINNEKIAWDTDQQGAVGRMQPKGLEKIINRLEGELSVQPFGKELIALLNESYGNSPDIQTASFKLVHALFSKFGLVVLIPDNRALKKLMLPVFENDLFHETSSGIAGATIEQLSVHHKVQAKPRAINLFYLLENKRERIEREGDEWKVVNTDIRFSRTTIVDELLRYPERFSPNVILRGLFQETILPNIVFVGGGGELAYWMELKGIFDHYAVPYPMLVLRNSFLIVETKWQRKIKELGLAPTDFFKSEQELLSGLVLHHRGMILKLENELDELKTFYAALKAKAGAVDKTLEMHIEALRAKATRPIYELEKKMLRAEKRKYQDQSRQIHTIKSNLFPQSSLQERIENFMPYYARWGQTFIDNLYEQSLALEQTFVVLNEEKQ